MFVGMLPDVWCAGGRCIFVVGLWLSADEIEEMLMNPNLLEDALAEISVLEQEDAE